MNTTNIILNLRSVDNRIVDQAFTFLYQEYFPVIRSFIKENSGTEEDAADIFQDALIVLYNKIRDKNFKLTCTLKTFLYSICRNLWLKKLNKRKKNLVKSTGFKTVELEPSIADILEEEEDALLVAKLLKKVGKDAEQLLIYFFFHDLKTDEVTKKMGYANEQVTRNKKSKCLKKLRELLKDSNLLKQLSS